MSVQSPEHIEWLQKVANGAIGRTNFKNQTVYHFLPQANLFWDVPVDIRPDLKVCSLTRSSRAWEPFWRKGEALPCSCPAPPGARHDKTP